MNPIAVVDEARTLFFSAGLAFPKLPAELARRLRKSGDWRYSTRALNGSPYNLDAYWRQTAPPSDYAVLAHAGHGINSYAIHYFLVYGRLRIFLQLAWGGVYEDNAACATAIARCFGLVDALVDTYDKMGERFPALTVVASDFYGCALTVGTEANPERLDSSVHPIDVLTIALNAVLPVGSEG